MSAPDLTEQSPPRDLTLTRFFATSIEKVWRAWTDPTQVRRWWGPTGWTSPVATMDVREGGTSLVCMRSPEGHDMYSTWAYRVVVPPQRLEYVFNLSDAAGRRADPTALGMPPDFPRDVRHIVTLEPVGEHTRLTISELGYTSQRMLELSRLGLEQCLDKMAASFAS